jgi:glutamate racemase
MEVIQGTVGTRIQLLDSALWTAKEAQDILTALKSLSNLGPDGLTRSRFMFTDMIQDVNVLSSTFLGCPLPSIERISLEVISK